MTTDKGNEAFLALLQRSGRGGVTGPPATIVKSFRRIFRSTKALTTKKLRDSDLESFQALHANHSERLNPSTVQEICLGIFPLIDREMMKQDFHAFCIGNEEDEAPTLRQLHEHASRATDLAHLIRGRLQRPELQTPPEVLELAQPASLGEDAEANETFLTHWPPGTKWNDVTRELFEFFLLRGVCRFSARATFACLNLSRDVAANLDDECSDPLALYKWVARIRAVATAPDSRIGTGERKRAAAEAIKSLTNHPIFGGLVDDFPTSFPSTSGKKPLVTLSGWVEKFVPYCIKQQIYERPAKMAAAALQISASMAPKEVRGAIAKTQAQKQADATFINHSLSCGVHLYSTLQRVLSENNLVYF